jgi:glutaredoxin 3
MKIEIYTTDTCPYCVMAKKYFADNGLSFSEYNVSRNPAKAEEMVKRTGQMGVPVIIINGKAMVGFDRRKVTELLKAG